MKSTPARALRENQLHVERFGVHKIQRVEFPLPQNTVTVHMTHQMTGTWVTRNLRWDERVTTEEPLEVKIGETGKITLELALLSPPPTNTESRTRRPRATTRPRICLSTPVINRTTPRL